MSDSDNPTEAYLPSLIAGDAAGLVAGFAGQPVLDDVNFEALAPMA